MNWIVLEQAEKLPDDKNAEPVFLLQPRKSNHIRKILKKTEPGETCKAIYSGLGRGRIRILDWVDGLALVSFQRTDSFVDFPRAKIQLVLPLPRPQTGKKILHLAGAYGLDSVLFYSQSTKNREYFTSPVYREEEGREHWMSGQEQTGSLSEVNFALSPLSLPDLNPIACLPTHGAYCENLVFDPDAPMGLLDYYEKKKSALPDIRIFLGSESGLSDKEKNYFLEKKQEGSVCILKLGEEILRTEFALNAILYVLRNKK